jgi:hypothetical protein
MIIHNIERTLLLLAVLLCSCNNPAQKRAEHKNTDSISKMEMQELHQLQSLKDTVAILKKFFNPDTIIHKIALWKPDPEAKFNMDISDDGLCHTNIDTIITIPRLCGTDKDYLIVFTTIGYSAHGQYGRPANYSCAYVHSNWATKGVYSIESFQRNFTTAGMLDSPKGNVALRKIGNCSYALDVTTGYQGDKVMEYESLFSLPYLVELFSFQNFKGGGVDSTSEYYDGIETNLTYSSKTGCDYDDMNVETLHTYFDRDKHKTVREKTTKHYSWDDETSQYEPVSR